MKKTLPIFLVILLIAAVVVNKHFLVDMENETVEEIINEIEITQEEEKSIVQEVKPKEDLREEHVEAVQQIPPKTKKIVEQDLSREEGEYDDGKKDGLWKYWDKKGIKEKEIIFEKGDDILWSFQTISKIACELKNLDVYSIILNCSSLNLLGLLIDLDIQKI